VYGRARPTGADLGRFGLRMQNAPLSGRSPCQA
jgi:hypothetical protein